MKNKVSFIILITIIVLILLIIFYINVLGNNKSSDEYLNDYLVSFNYEYDEELDKYYRIDTGNTMDEYLSDVNSNKNSKYIETYFSTSSFTFVKQIMKYNDGVEKYLKIESDITTNYLVYSYELTYNSASIMLSGNYTYDLNEEVNLDNIVCEVDYTKKLSNYNKDDYCKNAKNEVKNFVQELSEFVSDDKIKTIIDNGPNRDSSE